MFRTVSPSPPHSPLRVIRRPTTMADPLPPPPPSRSNPYFHSLQTLPHASASTTPPTPTTAPPSPSRPSSARRSSTRSRSSTASAARSPTRPSTSPPRPRLSSATLLLEIWEQVGASSSESTATTLKELPSPTRMLETIWRCSCKGGRVALGRGASAGVAELQHPRKDTSLVKSF